ncbi:E3 ubiquitin-protein ligase TRIM39-like [Embiotoca jacksoni]|uniref:E3 ubiquitin-protein ligase TRIM39-like n=1 Tax=Embiotoca jacksoni TaxID=100190 RepID=UPI003704580E
MGICIEQRFFRKRNSTLMESSQRNETRPRRGCEDKRGETTPWESAASPQLKDMASTSAPTAERRSLEDNLTCSICEKAFEYPVTTLCGHSFCDKCLRRAVRYNESVCPLCKTHVSKIPDVNVVLREIAQWNENEDEDEFGGGAVAVACDVCAPPKQRAKKSCLLCLNSFCATHLENHYTAKRLKGHKLVEPVEDLDVRACLEHGLPFELYNRRRQICICVHCMEDGLADVVSTECEWSAKKAELDEIKAEFQQKIHGRKIKLDKIDADLKSIKDKLEDELGKIEAVFIAMFTILMEAEARMLQPIKERRQVVEKEAEDLSNELRAEIEELQMNISKMDDTSALEDHILFLRSYPTLPDPNKMTDKEVKFNTSLSLGTFRTTMATMMEKFQQKLETLTSIELERVPEFTVDVKLDPTTAHRRIIFSDNGKEVIDGGKDQGVDDTPGRFELFGGVVARDSLTSGRSYWEVEVRNKSAWNLGVVSGKANRKGKLTLKPDNGFWVTAHYEGNKFAALTAPPRRLFPPEKPEKVGVFVDYEEGLVSFYDIVAQSHIFSFTECSFQDELYPYFSPHVKKDYDNTKPLIISPSKGTGNHTG